MITASAWIPTLPEQPGQQREDQIFDAVLEGGALVMFTPLEVVADGHTLRLDVATDALQIGVPGDSVRVACNALTASAIAEQLDCLLPTAKICDLIWMRVRGGGGVVLRPCTQTPDAEMAYTSRFVEESKSIDQERAGRCGLLWTVGKSFVLSPRVFGTGEGKAANYGWHVESGSKYTGVTPGVLVLQPLATAHVDTFADYSQLVTGLVRRRCYLDGAEADLADILVDPDLAGLVSSEGPLPGTTYPRTATHGPAHPDNPDPPPPGPTPEPEPGADWRSPLKKGMKGDDVKDLQERLSELGYDLSPYGADGDFGALTDSRVREFQAVQTPSLVVDGVVGAATRAALFGDPEGPDENADQFIQATNYRPANRTDVRWLMCHTMEASEKPSTALAVSRWFASGASAPVASAHWCLDSENTIGCVFEHDIAYGCGGANTYSVHIELAGYAKQSAEDWSDDFSQKMLRRAAKVASDAATRWGIPIEKIGATDMRSGKSGFCGHVDGTKAFGKSDHYDPGPNFPWEQFLGMVREEAEK